MASAPTPIINQLCSLDKDFQSFWATIYKINNSSQEHLQSVSCKAKY